MILVCLQKVQSSRTNFTICQNGLLGFCLCNICTGGEDGREGRDGNRSLARLSGQWLHQIYSDISRVLVAIWWSLSPSYSVLAETLRQLFSQLHGLFSLNKFSTTSTIVTIFLTGNRVMCVCVCVTKVDLLFWQRQCLISDNVHIILPSKYLFPYSWSANVPTRAF